ncbi:hypothetical protein Tco_0420413 [Tanacetum coccineum]|uniref:Uncharacterized protein n=1 Tax=Tanacetum coccineum TaxID=301880 RepID=A0ABQ5DNN3_9ASTR
MSTPTQCYYGIDLGSDEYAYSVLVMVPWDRMGTALPVCESLLVSMLRKVKLGSLASETIGLHAEFFDLVLFAPYLD